MGKLLNDFLFLNKKDESTISKTLYKELIIVEDEILKRKQLIEDSKQIIINNQINIKAISDATSIARKTFYNNDLLNKFVVENATMTLDKETKETVSNLKDKLKETEEKLNKVLYRDIQELTLQNEIAKLQKELEYAHKRIKSLEEQHEQDIRKLNKPMIYKI